MRQATQSASLSRKKQATERKRKRERKKKRKKEELKGSTIAAWAFLRKRKYTLWRESEREGEMREGRGMKYENTQLDI